MNMLRSLAITAAVVVGAVGVSSSSFAQTYVDIGVAAGPAPICPYGYYDYTPYPCAPYGYYGPDWFLNGIFIGVGPWFHGPAGFHGRVDPRFDTRHGYAHALPQRNERANPAAHFDRIPNFRGDEWRDGRGGGGRSGDRH